MKVITLGVNSCDCVVSKSALGHKIGDHIGRGLLLLHRLEQLAAAGWRVGPVQPIAEGTFQCLERVCNGGR